MYLVPNWNDGETHSDPFYIAAKEEMLSDARQLYGAEVGIVIKDFLTGHVSQDELDFLKNCKSMGSIADLVKCRVIIDNAGRKCLQTDSNVTWNNNNFAKLYALTFSQDNDAFNVSRCSDVYIYAK